MMSVNNISKVMMIVLIHSNLLFWFYVVSCTMVIKVSKQYYEVVPTVLLLSINSYYYAFFKFLL